MIDFSSLLSAGRWTREQAESLVKLAKAILSDIQNASETVAGIAKIATQGQTNTGTDDLSIVTPAKLKNTPIPGRLVWTAVTVSGNLTAGNAVITNSGTTTTQTLPSSPAIGDVFVVHAKGAAHRVARNGNTIDLVGSGNDLLIDDGSTAMLVVYGTNLIRIV